MPRIIRQALAERLLKSPGSSAFLRDVSLATGLPLRFATPLGAEVAVAGAVKEPALCAWMRSDARRARLCAKTIQEEAVGAERAARQPAVCGAVCAAGLREAAVPLRMGGEVFGYLLVGQVATQPMQLPILNRWRHALERAGCNAPSAQLEALAASVGVVEEERLAAALRVVEWAASQLAAQMEEHVIPPQEKLPPALRKACSIIRGRHAEPLSLGVVAGAVGMSREHFCTVFHKGTGLRFVDYLTRVRVERSAELLRHDQGSIADIAFASGFQSLTQFNRSFRRILGMSPREYRRGGRRGSGA